MAANAYPFGVGKLPAAALNAAFADLQAQIDAREPDASYSTAGTLATSVAYDTEVAMASWTANKAFTFLDGYVYALHAQCLVFNTDTDFQTTERINVKLRKAVGSTSAQILGDTMCASHGMGTLGAVQLVWTSYVANITGADIMGVHIGLSCSRYSGSHDNSIYGDASFPAFVVSENVGRVGDNPNLLAVAVNIT